MMTARVREILGWYGSDNAGTLTSLARLLNHGVLAGTGRLVILPVDQGFEHGPGRSFAMNPAAYDPRYHFELAIEAGCNAYAAPLGFLEAGAREFAGQVPLILKLSNHDVLLEERDPAQAITGSVEDAVRLGCVGIGFTIYPGSEHRLTMYGQLRALAEEAKQRGLAVVVWSYPRGSTPSGSSRRSRTSTRGPRSSDPGRRRRRDQDGARRVRASRRRARARARGDAAKPRVPGLRGRRGALPRRRDAAGGRGCVPRRRRPRRERTECHDQSPLAARRGHARREHPRAAGPAAP